MVEVAIFQDLEEDYCYTVIFEGSFYPAFRHEKELYYIDDNQQSGSQFNSRTYKTKMAKQGGAE